MDHVALFASAKIVMGPHSAGLANQLWCAPGTVIYEAGYDQCLDGCMDDEYYEMAIALGHEYFTGLGGGPHTDTQELCPCHVMTIFRDGGQTRDASNVKPRHQLNVVADAKDLPPELPDAVLAPGTYGGPRLTHPAKHAPKPPTPQPQPGAKPEVKPKPNKPKPKPTPTPGAPKPADTKQYVKPATPGIPIKLSALPDCSGRDSFPLGKSLRSVTDIFGESDIQIVRAVEHDEYGKLPIWGSPTDKFEQYCGILDRRIWIECPGGEGMSRAKSRPCTKRTYVPRHECAWIDAASVNQFVPGTVFDQKRMVCFMFSVFGYLFTLLCRWTD